MTITATRPAATADLDHDDMAHDDLTHDGDPADENLAEGLATDIGFGRAVIIGSLAGIVVMVAAIAVTLRLLDPDLAWGPIIGISAWTGLWAGLFLGGTVTVGRWSGARH